MTNQIPSPHPASIVMLTSQVVASCTGSVCCVSWCVASELSAIVDVALFEWLASSDMYLFL